MSDLVQFDPTDVPVRAVFDEVVLFLTHAVLAESVEFRLTYAYPSAIFEFTNGAAVIITMLLQEDLMTHLKYEGDVPDVISGEGFVKSMESALVTH